MHDRVLVFDALARAGLGLSTSPPANAGFAGVVPLLAHQIEAVQRLHPLLNMHRGALLADAVGLGKTYVALALAARYRSVDVIAPAGLLLMWRGAIARTEVQPQPAVRSLHAFSSPKHGRTHSGRASPHLVIIDEAHHLRTPTTRRYAAVAEWCRRAHVLLLSATPVHNTENDLEHLLALFLGARAGALDHAQRSALVVRRNVQDLGDASIAPTHIPVVVAHDPFVIGDSIAVTRALSSIPPPLPTRDGHAAAALVALGLVRAWCSSGAACLSMIGRRRSRAQALSGILAQGRWPSQHELRAWTITEDTVQLGLTELLVDPRKSNVDGMELRQAREQLARHTEALYALAQEVRAVATPMDRMRVEALRKVRAMHRGLAVIAFSQFADTVRGIGRLMQWDSGVATLTSQGGRVAGGVMSREEVLRRVAPHAHGVAAPAAHERIYLVLTTDLLAEGVNLQDAAVVVHLDLPWTPAAIAQREGRIARLGSRHNTVHVYSLSAPGGGAGLMQLTVRLRRKARAVAVALAPEHTREKAREIVSLPSASSPLQQTLRRWCVRPSIHSSDSADSTVHVVQHAREGWLAAVGDPFVDVRCLCGGWFAPNDGRTRATSDPHTLARLVQAAHPARDYDNPSPALVERYRRLALAAVRRRERSASAHATIQTLASPVHRAQRHARRLLASVSLSDRVRLAPKASLAVRSVRVLRGVGDERALDKLLGAEGVSLSADDWLTAVIDLADASRAASDSTAPLTVRPATQVFTLLLLIR